MTRGADFFFTSPACGGGRQAQLAGRGHVTTPAPSPTLTRLRGRENEGPAL
jgi:hypothetical protein